MANGVIISPDQLHVSYVHTPIRYAWDLQHQYLKESGLKWGLKAWIVRCVMHYMRLWDLAAASRVDVFLTNSNYIARRIWKCYRRESHVIFGPTDVDTFEMREKKEDFYLTASRLVPYKRVDLIARAFSAMPDRRLIIIGDGPEYKKVKAVAGPNVELLGYQPMEVLRDHMQRARAFVFAAEEDLGLSPIEAQACGTPVIAFGRGGLLDTVVPGKTGLFFETQSPKASRSPSNSSKESHHNSIRRKFANTPRISAPRSFASVSHYNLIVRGKSSTSGSDRASTSCPRNASLVIKPDKFGYQPLAFEIIKNFQFAIFQRRQKTYSHLHPHH